MKLASFRIGMITLTEARLSDCFCSAPVNSRVPEIDADRSIFAPPPEISIRFRQWRSGFVPPVIIEHSYDNVPFRTFSKSQATFRSTVRRATLCIDPLA